MEQKKQKIDDVDIGVKRMQHLPPPPISSDDVKMSQFKKAKVVDDDIGDDDIGVKRMQHLPPPLL